jgi:hypothetical protein
MLTNNRIQYILQEVALVWQNALLNPIWTAVLLRVRAQI